MPLPAEMDTALKLIEIMSILAGGGGLFYRIGRMAQKFEQVGVQQGKEITELKDNVKATNGLLVTLTAVRGRVDQVETAIGGRVDRVEDRQLAQGKRIDDVAREVQTYRELEGRLKVIEAVCKRIPTD